MARQYWPANITVVKPWSPAALPEVGKPATKTAVNLLRYERRSRVS
ncbi:hypothetical protein D3OALGA1CA_1413 [Olavius algarvensis associated proteobacterium Delta 3]|nr:hypothetical protein D3OALGB2SA_860 [Olavius algarvensis associated proteobacterium Delta 3]CAB5100907.1 hypothetical protein D3OALGA1CA_1413 [Olavius algarvensis associated proteobacterium Delta 3]